MAWVYTVVTSLTQGGSYNDVQNELNKLTPAQMASAKVGFTVTTNVKWIMEIGTRLVYQGVIIYDNTITDIPKRTGLTNTWTQQGFAANTTSDDTSYMNLWQSIVEYMNDPANGFTRTQLFYSIFSLNHTGDFSAESYYNTNACIWFLKTIGS